MRKVAPLPGTFMITAILGFVISAIYIYNISPTWGFAFCVIFIVMFIASIISMTQAPTLEIKATAEKKTKRKKKKKKKK